MTPVLGTVLGAVLILVGTLATIVAHRLSELEKRIVKAESYNRRLWLWARAHIDLYYRWRRDGAPDPLPLPDEEKQT